MKSIGRRLGRLPWGKYVLTAAWSTSFTIAAFLLGVIIGFIVLGAMLLLIELRADD